MPETVFHTPNYCMIKAYIILTGSGNWLEMVTETDDSQDPRIVPEVQHRLFMHSSEDMDMVINLFWSSPPEVFLGKGGLKISENLEEHPFWRVISIKSLSNLLNSPFGMVFSYKFDVYF